MIIKKSVNDLFSVTRKERVHLRMPLKDVRGSGSSSSSSSCGGD